MLYLSKRCQLSELASNSRPVGRSNTSADVLDDQTSLYSEPGDALGLCFRKACRALRLASAMRAVGGAYRDRTDDLLNANQALSQLS